MLSKKKIHQCPDRHLPRKQYKSINKKEPKNHDDNKNNEIDTKYQKNDRIEFKINTNTSSSTSGTIKWIGTSDKWAKGIWYGIELNEKNFIYGHNGFYNEERFFGCADNFGVYIQEPQIIKIIINDETKDDETKDDETKDDEKNSNDGKDNDKEAPSIQIVHISDTHSKHRRFVVPEGDILIHSGDFATKCGWKENDANIPPQDIEKYLINNKLTSKKELAKYIPFEILDFNKWLSKQPHKYKIVIAGNHERLFNQLSFEFIQKYIITNGIYLQDSFVEIYGLKIYGTPWTKAKRSNSFGAGSRPQFMYSKWEAIPKDTDILITHLPPLGIKDLAWGSKYGRKYCGLCKKTHESFKHWGCKQLLKHIQQRIKPKLHLFGHVHDTVGFQLDQENDILFVNSAMDIAKTPHRIKIVFDK